MKTKTAIEVFQGFKTSDGEIFTEREKAIKWQLEIELRDELVEALDDYIYARMDSCEFIDLLVEHKEKLKEAFNKI